MSEPRDMTIRCVPPCLFLTHYPAAPPIPPALLSSQFAERAPADVVGKVREQAEEAEEKLAMVQARLVSLPAS